MIIQPDALKLVQIVRSQENICFLALLFDVKYTRQ